MIVNIAETKLQVIMVKNIAVVSAAIPQWLVKNPQDGRMENHLKGIEQDLVQN